MLNISDEQLCKEQFMFSLFFIKRTQGGVFLVDCSLNMKLSLKK